MRSSIAKYAALGCMSRVKMPEIDGSPGAPQLSTTFHHVMPFIFSTANQAR